MGSTQGEIRVGPSHQAKLPENRLSLNALDSSPDPEFTKEREEVRWVPSVTLDGDLVMYLRAARSMAAFAGMCDGGSAEDGCIAARRDGTTINAMDVLHDCGYDPSKALQTLVKCPVPKSIEKKWTDEETKRFVKGLRQFGKNFFRIKKDLLPHKDTPELVEFYYLWKKTPGANNNRPHRRRRQGSLRRNRNTRNTRGGTPKEDVSGNSSRPSPSSKDPGEASSGSDDDNDNSYDDSDSRENGGYRCQHCFTTSSRDWLHATNGPKQGALLCYTCHTYYRQYGDLPPSSTTTTRNETYLFQPVQSESPEGSPGRMRTRNKAKETPTKERSSKLKRNETTTPEPEGDKKSFCGNSASSAAAVDSSKSPASVLSSPSGDKSKKKIKSESTPNRKRSNIMQNDGEIKRAKREHGPESASGESDCESLLDEIDPSSPAATSNANVDEKSRKSDSMSSQSPLSAAAAATVTAAAQPPLPPPPPPLPPPPPPLLPSNGAVDNVEIKIENGESLLCPSAAIFSSSSPPLSPEMVRNSSDKKPDVDDEPSNGASEDNKSFTNADIEKNDSSVNVASFSFEQSSNACLKSENIYGYTPIADSKDEILPPVLTSGEENYVPKDEMPTLHANTSGVVIGGADTKLSESHYSTSGGYSSQMEMPVVDTIKTEPGLQSNDEASASLLVDSATTNLHRSGRAESPLTVTRHSSSSPPIMPATTFASLVATSSPSSSLTYSSRVPSESPKPPSLDSNADRLSNVPPSPLSAASVLLPPAPYSVYQENERADKCLMAPTSANLPPPSASLNLTGSHHAGSAFPSYYHFSSPHPAHISDKSEHSPYLNANTALQIEPQDLKIKQEVVSLDQQGPPSVDPLQSLKEVKVPGYSNASISQPLLPTSTTAALSSTLETHSMGGSGNRSDSNSPFLSNVSVDEIKKESDSYAPSPAVTAVRLAPMKSPNLTVGVVGTTKISNTSSGDPARSVSLSSSSPPPGMKLSQTPPYSSVGQPSLISQSSSSTSTRTPTSSPLNNTLTSSSTSSGTTTGGLVSHANQPQAPPHSSSQPTLPPPPMLPPQSSPLQRTSPAHLAHPHAYMPSIHQHYFQHPLFAATAAAQVAHAMHHQYPHSPYSGYPYGFPYPTPYPIPQPIPPPRPMDSQKRDADGGGSTTLLTSHHSSSLSSSVTTRSLRDDDSNVHSQEITQMHHHSSSHHSSIHHHNDKQTISHSSSSSSSASVQHKVKRSSSPQHSSSSASCHVSATLSQSTSSSVSTNHGQSTHHSHHHQHTHHHQSSSAESPQLMNMSMSLGGAGNGSRGGSSSAAQSTKAHPPSVLGGPPPSILPSAHHTALSLTGLPQTPAASLEALRAHANAIHSPLLQSSHGLGHGGYLGPADMTLGNADLIKPDPSLLQSSDDSLLGAAGGAVEEDDILSPTNHIPKGPSPEPKIEDSECHRSQSAIFLRHWNRGDYNSCARTDLTFKPVPDSKLDKKRQERVRKQAEKEREEREKSQIRKIATPDKPETSKPPSRGPIETITSPYDRFARGAPYGGGAGAGNGGAGDTPALRQLSEYARPHAGFSPVGLPRSAAAAAASLALPPQCIDPMLHYQLNMYGPTPRERLEMEHFEREKREREIRELREKELNERLKEEMIKSAGSRLPNPLDPHWSDLRRYGALTPAAAAGAAGGAIHPFGLYAAAAAAGQPGALSPLERERFERLASAAGPFPRLSLLPGREASIGLHHSPDLLARPYADQLAHQAVTHEHIQRQILLERERYHPALVAQQHDEYLRYQIGRS